MPTLTKYLIRNGAVSYIPKIDPKPETKETNDNITIVNSAIPGKPAHFEVLFNIDAYFEEDGLEITNFFYWRCLISEPNYRTPYSAIEDQAARQIAPMLRFLADKIEADLPDLPPED